MDSGCCQSYSPFWDHCAHHMVRAMVTRHNLRATTKTKLLRSSVQCQLVVFCVIYLYSMPIYTHSDLMYWQWLFISIISAFLRWQLNWSPMCTQNFLWNFPFWKVIRKTYPNNSSISHIRYYSKLLLPHTFYGPMIQTIQFQFEQARTME